MTINNWIELGMLMVQIIGGILAVLAYFRIVKETNQNARERQQALDVAGQRFQDEVDKLAKREQKRANLNKWILGALAICAAFFMFVGRFQVHDRWEKKKCD